MMLDARKALTHQRLRDMVEAIQRHFEKAGAVVEVLDDFDLSAHHYRVHFVLPPNPPASALQAIRTFSDALVEYAPMTLLLEVLLLEVLPYVRGHREEAETVLRLGGLPAVLEYLKKETP